MIWIDESSAVCPSSGAGVVYPSGFAGLWPARCSGCLVDLRYSSRFAAPKLGAEPREPSEPKLIAQFDGFNLHAGTSFAPHERTALERFCRYVLRGPLSQARLSSRPDGKLVYRLKAPKADGTTHVVFTPMALLQRLIWLIPLPRIHLTRYHGVFAPAHPWRSRVIPLPKEAEPPGACVRKRRWVDWAELLKRVYA